VYLYLLYVNNKEAAHHLDIVISTLKTDDQKKKFFNKKILWRRARNCHTLFYYFYTHLEKKNLKFNEFIKDKYFFREKKFKLLEKTFYWYT